MDNCEHFFILTTCKNCGKRYPEEVADRVSRFINQNRNRGYTNEELSIATHVHCWDSLGLSYKCIGKIYRSDNTYEICGMVTTLPPIRLTL